MLSRMKRNWYLSIAALLILAFAAGCGAPATGATTAAATQAATAAATEAATTAAAQETTAAATQAATTQAASAAATTAAAVQQTTSASAASAASSAKTSLDPVDPDSYYITDGLTLTYFMTLNPKVTRTRKDYSEMTIYQYFEELTGVKIEFVHPPVGQESEKLNLMIASQDLPDLVFNNFLSYPGGFTKAIDDGLCIDIMGPLSQWGPNLYNFLNDTPEVRREALTDQGELALFPLIRWELGMKGVQNFFIRGDWLDNLNLKSPVTMDDWYVMLTAFRDSGFAPEGEKIAPFASVGLGSLRTFLGAWGLSNRFVMHDGKAVYSPLHESYREWLEIMSKWYAEGLIDSEFPTADQLTVDNMMSMGISGATFERSSKHAALINTFEQMGNTEARLYGTRFPTYSESFVPYNNAYDPMLGGAGTSITANNKHVEESTKYLDTAYSREGALLWEWGPEYAGLYTLDENGSPVMSEYVSHNPDGLSMDEAIGSHTMGSMDSARIFQPEMRWQRMMFVEEQNEAMDFINEATVEYALPNVSLTSEEAAIVSRILSDVETLLNEVCMKVILGQSPITEFDAAIQTMHNMGVDQMVEIHQTALERYYLR